MGPEGPKGAAACSKETKGSGLIKACQGLSRLVKECPPRAHMYKIRYA